MICEFCNGSGIAVYDDQECMDCGGSGTATCYDCGTTEDVIDYPEGPEYICTDCLFLEMCDD